MGAEVVQRVADMRGGYAPGRLGKEPSELRSEPRLRLKIGPLRRVDFGSAWMEEHIVCPCGRLWLSRRWPSTRAQGDRLQLCFFSRLVVRRVLPDAAGGLHAAIG